MMCHRLALVACLAAVDGRALAPRKLSRPFLRCPKGTVVKSDIQEDLPQSIDDCACLWGFEMSDGKCVQVVAQVEFRCPNNTFVKDALAGQPAVIEDCSCAWGFGMVNGECIPKFQCPAGNPVKKNLGRDAESIDDCSCGYTEVLYGSVCAAPKYSCPPGTYAKEGTDHQALVPRSIDQCVCMGNMQMNEDGKCAPNRVQLGRGHTEGCDSNSYLSASASYTSGVVDDFDEGCMCFWGYMKATDGQSCVEGPDQYTLDPGTKSDGSKMPKTYPWPGIVDQVVYRCPASSNWKSAQPPSSFDDCDCEDIRCRAAGTSTDADPDVCTCSSI